MKLTSALAGIIVASSLVLTGCASKVRASRMENPPPTEAYSKFGRIEIKPVVLSTEFAGQRPNEKAVDKINDNLFKRLGNNPKTWNSRPANGRTLLIEPVITDIRFIGVGARIWTGPLSGGSGVVVRVKVTDTKTGKVVDHPEFYQRSSAGAGFAFGVADNMMLTRVGDMIAEYLIANYDAAVGGKTGAIEEMVDPSTAK